MAITLFALPSLLPSLLASLASSWRQRGAARRRQPLSADAPLPAAAVAQDCGPARPLRVVRVLDAGRRPAEAGRMVISGRLADVCAELDRLAALEARSL